MSVTLRRKKLISNKISLYLDIYQEGKRKYEYLQVYLIDKPKNPLDRELNKENLKIAETIRAEREISLNQQDFGYATMNKKKQDFFIFTHQYTQSLQPSTKRQYAALLKQLTAFCQQDTLALKSIDDFFVKDFLAFLQNKLTPTTAANYYTKFKAIIHFAYKKKFITIDPTELIHSPATNKDSDKTYLNLQELKMLSQVESTNNVVKNAFLFACFTGLRHSDIGGLTHKNIINNTLHIYQTKTKQQVQIPLNAIAQSFLPTDKRQEYLFPLLPPVSYTNVLLQKWIANTSITKKVTFHVARHSFATNLLLLNTNVATVSKLMGHSTLQHTRTYLKVVENMQQEAVESLKW